MLRPEFPIGCAVPQIPDHSFGAIKRYLTEPRPMNWIPAGRVAGLTTSMRSSQEGRARLGVNAETVHSTRGGNKSRMLRD